MQGNSLREVYLKMRKMGKLREYTVKKKLDDHPDISGLHRSLLIYADFNPVDSHPDLYG